MATGAGSGYVVAPSSGTGPGVLVLHSWWGLTDGVRGICDRLADAGFVALAPDLHGDGRCATEEAEAEALLADVDPNRAAGLVVASISALRRMPATPEGRIGVLGYSMGASWALWAATRHPEHVAAASVYYGTQDIDFTPADAIFQGHFAEDDAFAPEDEVNYLEASLRLSGKETDFHRYPGTSHWFAEADRTDVYDESAATLAWDRTVAFLHDHLPG